MRGTTALLPAKYMFKQIYPLADNVTWMAASSTPRKQENINESREGMNFRNENGEPIVAFSRPPPMPPVLGPLAVATLFDLWWSRDSDDE